MDAAKEVQGVGVYMEFRKPGATTQFMLFPDGYNSSGNVVKAQFARRTITAMAPKKQWRMHAVNSNVVMDMHNQGLLLDPALKEKTAEDRLINVAHLMHSLLSGGWKLTNKPILVEVSKKDLDDVQLRKTPNKLMYRVGQAKTALGYPTDPVDAV